MGLPSIEKAFYRSRLGCSLFRPVSEDKHNHTLCEVSEQSEESSHELPKPS